MVKWSPHDSLIGLQTSLMVARCGTQHVKRIDRVSLGTVEGLHEVPVSLLCLFRASLTLLNGVDLASQWTPSDMKRGFSINTPLDRSEKRQETKRQVDAEQGNPTASAAGGGVSGTDGTLSHDVTGSQRAP